MKVCLIPRLSQCSSNIGGVNRVIHDLAHYLTLAGIEIVEDPDDADIIHCHAVGEHPKPDVYTNHGYWVTPRTPWEIHANKRMGKMITTAKIVTSVSEWSTEAYKDEFRHVRPRIIRNGVDVGKLQAIPKGRALERLNLTEPYLLYGKNKIQGPPQGEAIRALAYEMPNMHIVATMFPEGKIPPNVTVTGLLPYNEMLETIKDSLAMISVTKECFSIQVLESLAMGKPIVGWDYGGTAEAIQDGFNGCLERPGDALRPTVVYLLNNLATLQKGAYLSTLAYDLTTKIIPQYIQCYEELS